MKTQRATRSPLLAQARGLYIQPYEWFTLNNPYYKTYAPEHAGNTLCAIRASQVGNSGAFSRPDQQEAEASRQSTERGFATTSGEGHRKRGLSVGFDHELVAPLEGDRPAQGAGEHHVARLQAGPERGQLAGEPGDSFCRMPQGGGPEPLGHLGAILADQHPHGAQVGLSQGLAPRTNREPAVRGVVGYGVWQLDIPVLDA